MDNITNNDTTDPLLNRNLGDFLVEKKLGEGGFGLVYKARQLKLNREAVIKILHNRHTANQQITNRFIKEAKLASQLEHPYTAHIYAFGVEEDGLMWIAMEFVRGIPLDQYLKSNGAIQLDKFTPLLEKICEVIYTAHEYKIIHRDIKPANIILIERAGQLLPKLLDFGIARGLEIDSPVDQKFSEQEKLGLIVDEKATKENRENVNTNANNTTSNTVGIIGSPRYMAPEQWASSRVDARADIYSLGILTYECLTGKPPFDGEYYALAYAHTAKPVPLLGKGFPKELDLVMAKVMAKEPTDRYTSAIEFSTAFREVYKNSLLKVEPLPSEPTVLPTKVNLGKRYATVLVILFTICAALITYSFQRYQVLKPVNPSSSQKNVFQELKENNTTTSQEMILVKGGTFKMGYDPSVDDDKNRYVGPAFEATVADFYIDKTEVSNQDYKKFIDATKHPAPRNWKNGQFPSGEDSFPVTNVSWDNAQTYAKWAGKRLPTEKEWEYAARGSDGRIYPWGKTWQQGVAISQELKEDTPRTVGSLPKGASPFGVLDMAGNVWEWTADKFTTYPNNKDSVDPKLLDTNIIRGGSFRSDQEVLTTYMRNFVPPYFKDDTLGFRCAKSVK